MVRYCKFYKRHIFMKMKKFFILFELNEHHKNWNFYIYCKISYFSKKIIFLLLPLKKILIIILVMTVYEYEGLTDIKMIDGFLWDDG